MQPKHNPTINENIVDKDLNFDVLNNILVKKINVRLIVLYQ